jgi:hypothetical protein
MLFTNHKINSFNGLKANASNRVLRWLLLHEAFGVTFEYLLGKKIFAVITDDSSRLEIDSLKMQEETEVTFTLLSGSENSSISNIKSTSPMHTALIFI